MSSAGPAKLLSIYVNHGDKWHHEPLHLALMDRARKAGLGGVTLLHTEGGVGTHHLPHTGLNELLMAQMPVIVQIVDAADAIHAFLPTVREMVPEGLVTLTEVQVVGPEAPPLAGDTRQPLQAAAPREGSTVAPGTPMKELARRLLADELQYLYVVDADDRVIGVVGRRDLLVQILPPHPSGLALLVDSLPGIGSGDLHQRIQQAHAFTARQVMTTSVLSVRPGAPLSDAVRLMLDHRLQQVPVLDDGKLTGVITQQDVLRHQLPAES